MRKEKTIVNEITAMLRERGVYVLKMHGSAYMPPGLPDLWCVIGGRLTCLEVKRPGERPTPRQVHVIDRLRRAGATALVVTSVEEAQAAVFAATETDK